MDFSIIIEKVENICETKHIDKHIYTKSGAGKDFMSNIKKGSAPSIEKVFALASYLDCSIDYLLGRTEDPQAHKDGNNVTVGDSGIVGNVVNSSLDNTISLNEQEIALLDLFRSFDIVTRSRVIAFVADMQEKIKKDNQNK